MIVKGHPSRDAQYKVSVGLAARLGNRVHVVDNILARDVNLFARGAAQIHSTVVRAADASAVGRVSAALGRAQLVEVHLAFDALRQVVADAFISIAVDLVAMLVIISTYGRWE